MPIEMYRCEKCNQEYASREAAVECEASHCTPVSATVKQYTTKAFPYSLDVAFDNGETKTYIDEKWGY